VAKTVTNRSNRTPSIPRNSSALSAGLLGAFLAELLVESVNV